MIAKIKETVDAAILASGSKIEEFLIHSLVQKEVDDRVSIITNAYVKLAANTKLAGLFSKPDITTFSPEGKEILSFSAKRWSEFEAFTKRGVALTEAIDKAMASNTEEDYVALKEAINMA